MKSKTTTLLLILLFLFNIASAQKKPINPKHFDVIETNIEAIHQAFKTERATAKSWFQNI